MLEKQLARQGMLLIRLELSITAYLFLVLYMSAALQSQSFLKKYVGSYSFTVDSLHYLVATMLCKLCERNVCVGVSHPYTTPVQAIPLQARTWGSLQS
jgi:hypothetical protein